MAKQLGQAADIYARYGGDDEKPRPCPGPMVQRFPAKAAPTPPAARWRPGFGRSPRQRTQGMPGVGHTRSLVCRKKAHELVTTGEAVHPGIPCAMVLTVSFVVSLVIGLSCHHRRQFIFADLIPASRYQDATTSPSATGALVSCATRVHRILQPTFVTIAKRPSGGHRTGEEKPLICPTSQAERPATL
jgi:hypothetical protein